MIKLFADGADWDGIVNAASDPEISGFTTNPTLMKSAGVKDYSTFAVSIIDYLADNRPDTSISLEVFADDEENIIRQAKILANWGEEKNYDVYVKIPVMYTNGEPTYDLISKLANENINLNVTAVFTYNQSFNVIHSLAKSKKQHILSIFAGRIADAGVNPEFVFDDVHEYLSQQNIKNVLTLWASSREAYNYQQARSIGVDIITMTPDLIKKVKGFGKDLKQFSLETCQMFRNDALSSGFLL